VAKQLDDSIGDTFLRSLVNGISQKTWAGAVVVDEVALNLDLAGLIGKLKLICPQIGA
jgi:hypothetical protein